MKTKTIQYYEQQVTIHEPYYSQAVTAFPFKSCTTLINHLVTFLDVKVLGDLPNDFATLPFQVSEKKIHKFFEQVAEFTFISPDDQFSLLFAGRIITLPPTMLTEVIDPIDYETCPIVIQRLMEHGWTTYGQLPAQLASLENMRSIGHKAIEKFVDHLHHVIARHEASLRRLSQAGSFTLQEQIQHELQRIYDEFQNYTSESFSDRDLFIFEKFYEQYLTDHRWTLEAIGQELGVTRERIRQIHQKNKRRLLAIAQPIMPLLIQEIEKRHGFSRIDFFRTIDFTKFLVTEVLYEQGIYLYSEELAIVTTYQKPQLRQLEEKIADYVEGKAQFQLLTSSQTKAIGEKIKRKFAIRSTIFIKEQLRKLFLPTRNRQYVLRSISKAQIVDIVLQQFPLGIELYKNEEQIRQLANEIVAQTFTNEKDRAIVGLIQREELQYRILLWGRGYYIHRNFVTLDQTLLQEIHEYLEQLLTSIPSTTAEHVYEQFESLLQANNIPNKYALYTLLRLSNSTAVIAYPEFPKIMHAEKSGENYDNRSQIVDYLKACGHPVTTEQLRKEFVEVRGWKLYTLTATLSYSTEIISTNYSEYGLLAFYQQFQKRDFLKIAQTIRQKLEEQLIIAIDGIFYEYESTLEKSGIQSRQLLYSLLKHFYGHEFRFTRYPHIVSVDYHDDISFAAIIENYLLQAGELVNRSQMLEWLSQDVGANSRTFDAVLQKSAAIIAYTNGQTAQYIHRDILEWSEEKQKRLGELVHEHMQQKPSTFVSAQWVLDKFTLPQLGLKLPWNKELLINLLKRDESFVLIGSESRIIVERDNLQGIHSNMTFIAHVIRRKFGGKTTVEELRYKLKSYNFSRDGDFLEDTMKALAVEQAPFFIDGEMIALKN
ncbi:MAG: sigma factor-like helix-turn-helix DNA-binding protein [Culicoidibacterales bacterium]